MASAAGRPSRPQEQAAHRVRFPLRFNGVVKPMRRLYLSLLLASAPLLGGCAYAGLAPVLADAVSNSRPSGHIALDFEAAAAEACSARGSRYGRVTFTGVERVGEALVRVAGTVQEPARERSFTCDFRSNGKIAEFRRV
jgi:hypothetical protein